VLGISAWLILDEILGTAPSSAVWIWAVYVVVLFVDAFMGIFMGCQPVASHEKNDVQ
jgi:hypothetical protein